jgi:PDZ domain-containing protein
MDATNNTTTRSSVSLPPPIVVERTRVPQSRLWWSLPLLTVSWLVLLSIVVASVVTVGLWEIAPGSAEQVSERMSFTEAESAGAKRYEPDSPVMFVTALGNRLTALSALVAAIDPDADVQTRRERFGDIAPSEQRRLGFQSMTSSKQVAEFVALRRLGFDVSLEWGDIVVEQLVCADEPAELSACRQLNPGDTIRKVDGRPVFDLEGLLEAMSGRVPGEVIVLVVVPHGEAGEVERRVELMVSPDDPSRTIIGIVPADTRTVSLPFEVEIDTDQIGGPSAGLAFTLALIDELSPGELTGGIRVAATGTMSADESVGAIGALRQKTVAVRQSGAQVFLVPASQSEEELAEARRVAGKGLRIVPVASLAEALAVLEELGGGIGATATL